MTKRKDSISPIDPKQGSGDVCSYRRNPAELEGLVVQELAVLAPQTLLDETALAAALRVHPRTIRRMVMKSEIPPGVPQGNRRLWMAGRVLAHINRRLEDAEREVEEKEAALKKRFGN